MLSVYVLIAETAHGDAIQEIHLCADCANKACEDANKLNGFRFRIEPWVTIEHRIQP